MLNIGLLWIWIDVLQQHPLLPVLTLDFGLQCMAPPPECRGYMAPPPEYRGYMAPPPECRGYMAPPPEYRGYMAPPPECRGYMAPPPEYRGYMAPPPEYRGYMAHPPGLQCLVQVVLPYPAALLGPLALAHRKEFPLAGHCMMASETSCFFAGSGRPRLLCRICRTAYRHIPRFHCIFLANMSWTDTSSPSCDLYRSSPEFGLLPAGVFGLLPASVFWITSCQCYYLLVYFLILHVLLYLGPQLVSRHGDTPPPPTLPLVLCARNCWLGLTSNPTVQ